MARIGFRVAKYNKITNGTYATITSGGKVPEFEKVIDEKFAPEYNNAELYASDVLAESDYSFKKGVLTVTVADDNDKIGAELLGNKYTPITTSGESPNTTTTGGDVTSNVEDIAPEFGYGHIITKIVNGARKYKVEFFPRIKFTKANGDSAKTKGDSVEFSTTTIEGTVFPLEKDLNKLKALDWENHKTFDTYAEAETYLDSLLTPSEP